MSQTFHDIAHDALALDPSDRLRLATELIASVEGAEDPAWSEVWSQELANRSGAADVRHDLGEARGTPWNEVRARLLAKLSAP